MNRGGGCPVAIWGDRDQTLRSICVALPEAPVAWGSWPCLGGWYQPSTVWSGLERSITGSRSPGSGAPLGDSPLSGSPWAPLWIFAVQALGDTGLLSL